MLTKFALGFAQVFLTFAVVAGGVVVIVVTTDPARAGAPIPTSSPSDAPLASEVPFGGDVVTVSVAATSADSAVYGDGRVTGSDWVIVKKNPPPVVWRTPPHVPSPYDDLYYGMVTLCEAFGTHCDED